MPRAAARSRVETLPAGPRRSLEEAALDPTPLKLLHLAAAQVATKDLTAARQTIERARKLGLVPDQLSAADKARYDAIEAALPSSPGA